MHAATSRPRGDLSLRRGSRPELEIWFRAPGGREPDVLEIGMYGRRNPKFEAYWEGCLVAL